MIVWVWLTVGIAAATAALLAKRLLGQKVPDVTDRDFINEYHQKFEGDADAVIRERKLIGRSLGWPYQKLHPNQSFRDLSKLAGIDVSFEVGLSNLGDQLSEVYSRAQLEMPNFPDTVGQLISAFIIAKNRSSND